MANSSDFPLVRQSSELKVASSSLAFVYNFCMIDTRDHNENNDVQLIFDGSKYTAEHVLFHVNFFCC